MTLEITVITSLGKCTFLPFLLPVSIYPARVFTCCALSKPLIMRSPGQGLSLCPLLDLFNINPFHIGSIWKVDSSQILIKYPINKSKSMLRAQHGDNAPFRCCMKSWCWYCHLSEACLELEMNPVMSTSKGLLTKMGFIYLSGVQGMHDETQIKSDSFMACYVLFIQMLFQTFRHNLILGEEYKLA